MIEYEETPEFEGWFEQNVGATVQAMPAPRFQHDCADCAYLGQWEEYDLYFCTQGGNLPTVLARFSSESQDYTSGLHSLNPCLVEAQERAAAQGLLTTPAELLVLAEASDRIPTYLADSSIALAGVRSGLSERLGVGPDQHIPFQCEPDGNLWIGARNALVIMCAGAFLVWLIVKVING